MSKPAVILIDERHKTHGDWKSTSYIAQCLKRIVHQELNTRTSELDEGQLEALDMILTKIARIVCGDASHADHWDDIAGYAMLGKQEKNA
jgi:hypothetical protein